MVCCDGGSSYIGDIMVCCDGHCSYIGDNNGML